MKWKGSFYVWKLVTCQTGVKLCFIPKGSVIYHYYFEWQRLFFPLISRGLIYCCSSNARWFCLSQENQQTWIGYKAEAMRSLFAMKNFSLFFFVAMPAPNVH